MSRHVLDKAAPKPTQRSIRTFLELERTEAGKGISRVIAALDRKPGERTGARLPAFLKIGRGYRP